MRDELSEWCEALGRLGWPAPEYVKRHPHRHGRPPCTWVFEIRWDGEGYQVVVCGLYPPREGHMVRLDDCPIPPPISAYRWAAERCREAAW